MSNNLTQPKGSVTTEINKQILARINNTKIEKINYISIGLTVDDLLFLYDKASETTWNSSSASGNVISWTITDQVMTLITSYGTFTLPLVETITSNELSKEDTANGIGFIKSTVGNTLTKILSLGDIGVQRPILGYDVVNDKIILDKQTKLNDNDLLHYGSISIGKKFRGVRRNAINLSLMGANNETSASDMFNTQIVGVSNSTALANYGLTEGVNLFMYSKLQAPEPWEVVSTATYTATSAIIGTSTPDVFNNLKRGDCIRTNHSTPCWGMVDSWNAETGTINVSSWATSAGTLTPDNGIGFVINYISKAYCMNGVASIAANASGNNIAIAEFDGINHKAGATLNGLDLVMLSQTTQDGTAAFLSRTASDTKTWLYGFRGERSRMNFYSTGAVYNNYVSTGSTPVGIRVAGTGHTYAMICNTSNDMTDLTQPNISMALHSNGAVIKLPIRYQTVTTSTTVNPAYHGSLVNASTQITITLPTAANYVTGSRYEMYFIRSGTYSISGNGALVNSASTYTLNVSENYKKYSLLFDGFNWFIFS